MKKDIRDGSGLIVGVDLGDRFSRYCVLEQGPARFNWLKRTIGDISQKVLTKTLRELAADGYITRTVFDESPPKVVYELTEMGTSVLTPVARLVEWAEENHASIRRNRGVYEKGIERRSATRR